MEDNNDRDRYLNYGLLLKIFVRLPICSVFRFKCVSKHWNSIISESSFARIYVSHATNASKFSPRFLLLFDVQTSIMGRGVQCFSPPTADSILRKHLRNELPLMVEQNDPDQPLPMATLFYLPPTRVRYYHVIAASSGFFLLCVIDHYYICNFVTREIVAVRATSNLKIDPHSVGFITQTEGPFVERFRIAQALKQRDDLVFQVYSSETAIWTEHRFNFDFPISWDSKTPKFAFKGHLHWVDYNAGIFAYDPFNQNKHCRLLKFPNSRTVIDGHAVCFSVSKEHVRLIETPTSDTEVGWICKMWRLEDYDMEEWCLEHRITHDRSPLTILMRSIPLLCDPVDPEIVYFCWIVDGLVISFNLQTKELCIDPNWKPHHREFVFKAVLPVEIPIWPSPIPRPVP